MKQILLKLTAGEKLTRRETQEILVGITEQKYSNEQISALLMALNVRGITTDELLGFRDGILQTGTPVELSPYKVLDIVGTGGDGKNTFNISTCSCFVVAGAGYKVAKHGNYASTSVSGASNVIEEHGIKFTADRDRHIRNLEECGFTYLHAQLFAHAMKFVGPVRKILQVPTCFNLLGPLVNPSRPSYQMLGTANLEQLRLYHSICQELGIGYTIVTSLDGYDEISLTSDFKVASNQLDKICSPADYDLPKVNPAELYGGTTKQEAAKIFDSVLDGTSTEAQKNVVLINAAFAIKSINADKPTTECLAEARESLESRRALETFRKFVSLNS